MPQIFSVWQAHTKLRCALALELEQIALPENAKKRIQENNKKARSMDIFFLQQMKKIQKILKKENLNFHKSWANMTDVQNFNAKYPPEDYTKATVDRQKKINEGLITVPKKWTYKDTQKKIATVIANTIQTDATGKSGLTENFWFTGT